ncbi:hypothetical protein LCGC14_0788700 [marine sediment metagenome]|uniref:Uncharacterized protein n=1 Tax=marine sediment metagenome TaxID=412755 RepID=A0A0F9PXH3_9ZZZZ
MKHKKKKVLSGSKEKKESLVSSNIEHTNNHNGATPQVSSLKAYRKSIEDMTHDIKMYALKQCPDNLLSVKMSLMGAVRLVEDMMKMNREER